MVALRALTFPAADGEIMVARRAVTTADGEAIGEAYVRSKINEPLDGTRKSGTMEN